MFDAGHTPDKPISIGRPIGGEARVGSGSLWSLRSAASPASSIGSRLAEKRTRAS